MVRIHALLDDIHAGSNLRLALPASAWKPNGPKLQFEESWDDFRDEITRGSVDVAVVDPRLGFLGRHLGYGRALLYLSRVGAESTNLREVRRVGFSFILISGLDDDPGSLRQALGNATAHVFLERVLARLDGRLEAGPANFLGRALGTAVGAKRVDELAKGLQMFVLFRASAWSPVPAWPTTPVTLIPAPSAASSGSFWAIHPATFHALRSCLWWPRESFKRQGRDQPGPEEAPGHCILGIVSAVFRSDLRLAVFSSARSRGLLNKHEGPHRAT